jgi:hypothetical protein
MNLYQPTITGSLSVSGSVNISGSINIAGGGTISGTASIATTALTASSADNLLVRNTLTAQTLVVQTITSSVDYVTGSTRFGSIAANTHQFTGSMSVSGSVSAAGYVAGSSLVVFTNDNQTTPAQLVLADSSNNRQLLIGYNSGSNYGSIQAIQQGVGLKNLVLNSQGGNVGIGTTNPSGKLDVWGTIISSASSPSNTVGTGPSIYLSANSGSSYSYLQQGVDRFIYFGFTGGSWYERLTINNVTGNVGIGTSSPKNIFQITNLLSSGVLPSIGSIGDGTSLYLTNNNTGYGMLMGMLPTGNGWIQVQRTDSSAVVYNLLLQPNGGNVYVNGGIFSSTGQYGSEKTVQINALNTSYLIFSGALSGIVSARDNTNGGSGLWLLDPNGNGGTATLVAQNWINGVYTVFYSGGNTYVQKTSGNVPVIFHYSIYGN